jgi:hypothetical protein
MYAATLDAVDWRCLLAKAAVYKAIGPSLASLCDVAPGDVSANTFLAHVHMTARQSAAESESDEDAVARMVDSCCSHLDGLRAATDGDEAHLLSSVRRGAERAGCQDPFAALFERVLDNTAALYTQGDGAVRLAIAKIQHPRANAQPADPYALTAVTRLAPPEVELRISIDEFGPEAYAAIPMVLAHECIAHAFAGHPEINNSSPFSEGLMDWVAQRLVQRWATSIDAELAPASREHAVVLEQVLLRTNRPRRRGHRAARTLQSWMEHQEGLSVTEAEDQVVRLGVALNALDVRLAFKDEWIARVHDLSQHPILATRLSAWLSGAARPDELLFL